jgi:hypothetical protein
LLELVIQLTVVLVVRSSKIFNFWSSPDDTAVSVYCMPLFFHSARVKRAMWSVNCYP